MAEIYTLARPYAEAVFELAQAGEGLERWSQALQAISAVTSNEDVIALMANPEITDARLADAIIGVAGDDLHGPAQNFVRVLAANGRLELAPAVFDLFEARRAEVENRVDVTVRSAVPFSEAQQSALANALEKRLSSQVRLQFAQDDSVIGGAVIRAGDLVIDASLSSQLERMRQSLAQ